MTKLPIFLSTLSLLGGSIPANSVVGTGIEAPMNDVTASNTLEQNTTGVITNQNVAGLEFTSLDLNTGQLEWTLQYEDTEGRTFSRAIFVSLDYMNGETEAEADEALAGLDYYHDSGWAWDAKLSARDGSYKKGTEQYAYIAWGSPRSYNQSDFIYYAFEYKNWHNSEVEPVWYRGKIDYRKCAHDPSINAYGSVCKFSLNEATNQYEVSPSGGTLAYDDEMKQIAHDAYVVPITQKIEALEKRKAEGDDGYRDYLGGADYEFESTKHWIDKMHMLEPLADEISDLEQRLEQLHRDDSSEPGDGDSGTGDSGTGDSGTGDSGTGNSGTGNSGTGDLGSGSDDTDADGSTDTEGDKSDTGNTGNNNGADADTGTGAGGIGNNVSNNLGMVASNSRDNKRFYLAGVKNFGNEPGESENNEVALNETDNTGVTPESDLDDRSSSNTNKGSSDIEIPELGTEEPWLKRRLWVLALPAGTILLLMLILAKRRSDDD